MGCSEPYGLPLQSHHAQRRPLASRGFQIPATNAWNRRRYSFCGTLVPSNAMVVYAALYAMLLILLAQLLFSRRDL
jgi:hypothetical protein